jgi:hypothetical protein
MPFFSRMRYAEACVTMVFQRLFGPAVLQSMHSDPFLVPGFQIISQLTPQAVGLEATGFPAADGDSWLQWDAAGQTYTDALTYFAGLGWVDDELNIVDPVPAIGEAGFYQRGPTAGTDTWTRDFSVNP